MKRTISFILGILILNNILFAQLTVEKLNHLLDTKPYFGFRIDYKSSLVLPDSVKYKLLTALSGQLTPYLQDSLLMLTAEQKEFFLEQSKQQCGQDSICIGQVYQKIITDLINRNDYFFKNQPISDELILASGNWGGREAIAILENAVRNERYGQRAISMALAKLGNDSIKQTLIEKYTLSYILQTTELDTINDNFFYGAEGLITRILNDGMNASIYLKNKDIMLNLLDLIYVRGRDDMNIGISYTVSWFVNALSVFYFYGYPNFDELDKICTDYAAAIWMLDNRKLNKKEKKKLETLLSTEYRTKIKNQLCDWIIENVNFEE